MNLQSGQMLASYRLIDQVGAGGMGVVWRALDTRLDREVALKVLPHDAARAPRSLERFEREAKAVAALNHPNIVTLYSVEEADTPAGSVRFITMELVEGRTLAELIPDDGLALEDFFACAIPLSEALAAAHERGIIHRDLKPANVMIGNDGRLRILDFGLAKLWAPANDAGDDLADLPTAPMTELTREGQIMGTAAYMPPELLQGRPVDHRGDLFSLGVVLYEMATGRRPFKADSSADLISCILRDDPQSVSDIKAGFPKHLGRIVRHCLEKDRERRYQTAKDLRNELEDLKNEVLSGSTPGRAVPRRRTRSVWAVPIVAGFAALALAVMILRPTGSAEAAPPSAVAVLPLANLTGDPDRDYIGEGISASLITRLREFSGLRVIGRSALWGEAGGGTPYERARRLGADILLEGELRHSERDLLVQVNLIDVDSGVILWSEGFDGSHEELPALQARIERRLAEAIAIPLSSNEQRRLERDPTKSIPAYDYYLRGQKLLTDEADTQGAGAATEMFRQAIRLDPGFALAHVGLSEALWLSYRTTRSRDRLTEAEVAARQAMEIDPELAAAQVALARILRATGRVSASIAGLRQALDRHPRPEQAYQELAISYERVGDLEEAERCLRAAATIRSEDWFNWNSLGSLLERSGRYAEARDAFVTAAEAAPAEVGTPHENLAALTILEGRFDEAIEAYERIPRPIRDPVLASNIATAFYFSSRADKWDQAETYYRLAQRLAPDSPTIRRNLADLYVEVGRHDEALQNYREALRLVEERLRDDPSNHHLRLAGALYAAKAERCSTAMPTATELEAVLPATARNAHKLAQVYAICDRRDDALRMIRDAIDLGISNRIIAQEPEFIPLRADAEFLRLTADATEPRRRPNRP